MLCFHSYKRFSRAAFLRLFAEWSRRRHKHTENVWVVPTIYMMRFTDFVEWKRDLWCEKCIHTIGKASSPFFLFFFFIFAVNKITYRQWVVYVVWSSSGEKKGVCRRLCTNIFDILEFRYPILSHPSEIEMASRMLELILIIRCFDTQSETIAKVQCHQWSE